MVIKKLKKALIITYYWPPSGGPGVQRALYFVKYLRLYGWEPIVFTVMDGEYPVIDENLIQEIPEGVETIRQKSWEPYAIFKRFKGINKKERLPNNIIKKDKSIIMKLAIWVRGNYFIPDARKFWIKPSVKNLSRYLEEHKVDVIFSTSPPQSTHLIALAIANKFSIPWVVDFRDPWTKIGFYKDLMLSKKADTKHKEMEQSVLSSASIITAVTEGMANDFSKLANRPVHYLPNGFDDEKEVPNVSLIADKFVIAYAGGLTSRREPDVLWKVLEKMCETVPGFKEKLIIKFAGNIHKEVLENISNHGLHNNILHLGYLPHKEIYGFYRSSDALIITGLPGQPEILPGKLFECMYNQRPILGFSDAGSNIEQVILQANAGYNIPYGQYDKCWSSINDLYMYKSEDTVSQNFIFDKEVINRYTRKNLTKELCGLFDGVCN